MRFLIGASMFLAVFACAALAQTPDEDAIRSAIANYDAALKAGDVDAVMAAYIEEAVFMPLNVPALVGQEAVRAWYQAFLDYSAVDLNFAVDEVVVSGHWAFARATFLGTETPRAGGGSVEIDGKAIFILQKQDDGSWKIARYLFNLDTPSPWQ